MKSSKRIGLFVLSCTLLAACGGQTPDDSGSSSQELPPVTYNYGEDEMYEKIWESKVIHNESVVFVEGEDGRYSAGLLYTPTRIISVRNQSLEKEYSSDQYYIEGNRIYLNDNAKMPKLTKANLACDEVPATIGDTYDGRTAGSKILFTEGVGILLYQTMVTYEHNDSWFGSIPAKKGSKLPKLQEKLNNGEEIVMVTNGDSIFCGCNTSGLKGIEPFQDPFPTGFANEITRRYGCDVVHHNTAVGGMLSNWGRANVMANICNYMPDLAIIGFGMNDGSWNVSKTDYIDNIDFMVRAIQTNCPDCSIIVCATILASEVSPQANGCQKTYLEPLLELENEYENLAVMDMTTFSGDLFKKKISLELFANNINHPADWLARSYVTNLLTTIEEDK